MLERNENIPKAENNNICTTTIIFQNDLLLETIGVVHTNPDFVNTDTIQSQINTADFVAVETDITRLSNFEQVEWTGFNDMIFSKAWDSKKPVICCDPLAETDELSLASFMSGMVSMTAGFMLTTDLALRLKSAKITRRDFLKLLGIGAAATVFSASTPGKALRFVLEGCGEVNHPQPLDYISYEEFRNTSLLLGINQISKANLISGKGVQFIGKAHIADLKGYTEGQVVNIGDIINVHRTNLFTAASKLLSTPPTIRIWTPSFEKNKFDLAVRIPISYPD